jgi:hypothetical protein
MSAEDFLKNNRGINDGQDLPPEFMRSLYERIVSNEIQVRCTMQSLVFACCSCWGSAVLAAHGGYWMPCHGRQHVLLLCSTNCFLHGLACSPLRRAS